MLETAALYAGIGGIGLIVFLTIMRSVVRQLRLPEAYKKDVYRILKLIIVATTTVTIAALVTYGYVITLGKKVDDAAAIVQEVRTVKEGVDNLKPPILTAKIDETGKITANTDHEYFSNVRANFLPFMTVSNIMNCSCANSFPNTFSVKINAPVAMTKKNGALEIFTDRFYSFVRSASKSWQVFNASKGVCGYADVQGILIIRYDTPIQQNKVLAYKLYKHLHPIRPNPSFDLNAVNVAELPEIIEFYQDDSKFDEVVDTLNWDFEDLDFPMDKYWENHTLKRVKDMDAFREFLHNAEECKFEEGDDWISIPLDLQIQVPKEMLPEQMRE